MAVRRQRNPRRHRLRRLHLRRRKITLPAGTQLSIRLNDEVNSEKAQVGDVFHGSISAPITIDEQTVIPTTADVEGRVVDVKSAGRFAGAVRADTGAHQTHDERQQLQPADQPMDQDPAMAEVNPLQPRSAAARQ